MSPKSETRAEAEAKLQPGDIVLTTIGKRLHHGATPAGAFETGFRSITKRLQGEYTHSALYTGDGKVVELRYDTGFRKVPLSEATKNKDFLAVRPKAPASERRQAKTLDKMYEDHKGGDTIEYSSLPFLLKTVAEHVTKDTRGKGDEEIEKNRFICSNLVSHAYPKVDFQPRKGSGYIIPRDFVDSPHTKPVVLHRNRRRHDREDSMKISMNDPRVMTGFADTVEKTAILGTVGRGVLKAGLGAARKVGLGNQASGALRKGMQMAGGGRNLANIVGAGTVAGGVGLAAGGAAGRASR